MNNEPESNPESQTQRFSYRLPKWMEWWLKETISSFDLEVLRVLAQTGLPRAADVAAALRAEGLTGYAPRNVSGIIRRFQEWNVVEVIEEHQVAWRETRARMRTRRGGDRCLVRLTERGRDAARLILGVEPAPSHATLLLARHKNPVQALLVLEAADLLREAGYAVTLFPQRVELPGDSSPHIYTPNLVGVWGGKTFYIEVKRDTYRNPRLRRRKWQNYHVAAGGEFYVITPDRRALESLRDEILVWARDYACVRQLRLWMSCINEVREAGRQGEDFWMYRYQEPQWTYW